jgi:hypothetical protein
MSDNKGLNTENKDLNIKNINIFGCKPDPCATVTTQIEPLTEQRSITPTAPLTGNVYFKLPVILAESNITIPVEATITLDQPVREIKRIKKNVFLTQSRLIPFSGATPTSTDTGILFIAGFVRKNIEYATQTCPAAANPNYCGDIRHCTIEAPFTFTTRVTFLRPPVFTENTPVSELEFFENTLRGCDICAESVIGSNPCDQSFSFTEVFNEKPFVELVSAAVTEVDIHTNPTINCVAPTEQTFTTLTEKLLVNLTLKVLQKQQVLITLP